ncbi:MAG: DegT/DnrJ/EryC1/StrS family aminotransferase [Deltaproteobacteria bacterium]|nr:DegT/DnrJ/EryC1/StrS family aminotransferase [Deltaproteobacteria bacterium]
MPSKPTKAAQLAGHQKLAIDGGVPIRSTLLPYSRQNISEEDIASVSEALRSDIITRGPYVQNFERAVADMVEMPYAVAFCNATAALHAVMAMIGAEKGRVITSPITFAATSNSVLYCNGKAEFQDVESSTMNLDPHSLKDLKDVVGVVPVDFSGNPCDYPEFQKLQAKYKFRLISDAAHSLGATLNKKPAGSFADITVFSFHPVKSLTTGEGGMVVCKNKEEAEFLQRFRSHGIVRTETPGFYRQEFLGFNYNVTDIQCALGLSQLKSLPNFISRREEIAMQYNEFFAKSDLVDIPVLTKGARSAWHLYPLRLKLEKLTTDRVQFLRALNAENIGANVHYIPVYWHPHYERMGYKRGLCPKAEHEYLREISIPVFPGMTAKDISDVCQAVEKVLAAYSR